MPRPKSRPDDTENAQGNGHPYGEPSASPPVSLQDPPVGSMTEPPESPDFGDEPNRPVHVIRFGLVRASIWLNQTEYGPRHHVTCSRLYRGHDDKWYYTTTFGYRDLLALAKCLDWAHSYIAAQIAGDETPF